MAIAAGPAATRRSSDLSKRSAEVFAEAGNHPPPEPPRDDPTVRFRHNALDLIDEHDVFFDGRPDNTKESRR